jgi:hypothetical protein
MVHYRFDGGPGWWPQHDSLIVKHLAYTIKRWKAAKMLIRVKGFAQKGTDHPHRQAQHSVTSVYLICALLCENLCVAFRGLTPAEFAKK